MNLNDMAIIADMDDDDLKEFRETCRYRIDFQKRYDSIIENLARLEEEKKIAEEAMKDWEDHFDKTWC